MSLIQEALRRQQEEAEGGGAQKNEAAAPVSETPEKPVIRLSSKKTAKPDSSPAPAEPPRDAPASVPQPSVADVTPLSEEDTEDAIILPPAEASPLHSPEQEMDDDATTVPESEPISPPPNSELRLKHRSGESVAEDAQPTLATDDKDAVRVRPGEAPRRDHSILVLLGVFILILFLLAGGGWAVLMGIQLWRKSPAATEQARVSDAGPRVAETPAPLAVPPAEPSAGEADRPRPPPALAPADVEVAIDDPVKSDPPDKAPETLPTADPVPDVEIASVPDPEAAERITESPVTAPPEAAPPPPPRPMPPPRTAEAPPPVEAPRVASVRWPRLHVNGVVGSERSGSAIINNQIVDVGSRIEGVRLLGIAGLAVRLEYQGEQRLVQVGKTID